MKYYIIAGEASGDMHGANLMREILHLDPHADIRFWGGDEMQSVGGTLVRHIRDLAIMGIIEVAMNLRTVLGNLTFCKKDILEFNPDAIIYIDYPSFNLKIAKFAHNHGFRNYHYISPSLWAWKKYRIKPMRRDLDGLFYILPFEQDFYRKNNFPHAQYVGNPLLDQIERFKATHADSEDSPNLPLIAMLPGSRKMELKKVLPPMLRLAQQHPEYQFTIAGMSIIGESFYQNIIRKTCNEQLPQNIKIVLDSTYDLLTKSYAALVCSGTATLETGLFNVPQVVCYSANALSIAIARLFIGSRIKYISLVNLIADKQVVIELLQKDLNDTRIEQEFKNITTNTDNRNRILKEYAEMRQLLGNAGASARTAQLIVENINPKHS